MGKGPRARFGKILLKLSLLGEVSPSFIEKCFFKGGLENIGEDFNGHSPMSSTSSQSEDTTNNKNQSENENNIANGNDQSDQDKDTFLSRALKLNGMPIKQEAEEIVVEITQS
jgi:hypothetical protein